MTRYGLDLTITVPAAHRDDELLSDAGCSRKGRTPGGDVLGTPPSRIGEVDTLDNVARDHLRPTVQAFAQLIRRLDDVLAELFQEARKPLQSEDWPRAISHQGDGGGVLRCVNAENQPATAGGVDCRKRACAAVASSEIGTGVS